MDDPGENLRYYAEDPAYAGAYEVAVPSPDHRIRRLIGEHIPPGEGHCIEIGCSPGGFLTLFGELGYTLHGIDFDPRIQTHLPRWLEERRFRPGQFMVGDFTRQSFPMLYDVVYSLGFIEHFTNWMEIVVRHVELVRPGGWLLIGTPNYAGIVQRVLHKLLEEENYKTHVTASMNPGLWKQILEGAGFEVTHAGPVGSFDLWTRGTERLPRITREFEWMIDDLKPVLAGLDESRSFASAAYLAVVAHRTAGAAPAELLNRPDFRAGIDAARKEAESRDRSLEEAATRIVAEMRAYFERRSRPSTVVKDLVRQLIGRG